MKKMYNKQRTMGLILILISVFATILGCGNGDAMLLLMPPGVYLICTKEIIIYDDVEEEDEEES